MKKETIQILSSNQFFSVFYKKLSPGCWGGIFLDPVTFVRFVSPGKTVTPVSLGNPGNSIKSNQGQFQDICDWGCKACKSFYPLKAPIVWK